MVWQARRVNQLWKGQRNVLDARCPSSRLIYSPQRTKRRTRATGVHTPNPYPHAMEGDLLHAPAAHLQIPPTTSPPLRTSGGDVYSRSCSEHCCSSAALLATFLLLSSAGHGTLTHAQRTDPLPRLDKQTDVNPNYLHPHPRCALRATMRAHESLQRCYTERADAECGQVVCAGYGKKQAGYRSARAPQ